MGQGVVVWQGVVEHCSRLKITCSVAFAKQNQPNSISCHEKTQHYNRGTIVSPIQEQLRPASIAEGIKMSDEMVLFPLNLVSNSRLLLYHSWGWPPMCRSTVPLCYVANRVRVNNEFRVQRKAFDTWCEMHHMSLTYIPAMTQNGPT